APAVRFARGRGPRNPSPDIGVRDVQADASGSHHEHQVTGTDPDRGEQEDTAPAWSPDGRQIAFTRWELSGGDRVDADLFVINADGSGRRAPPGDARGGDGPPGWR